MSEAARAGGPALRSTTGGSLPTVIHAADEADAAEWTGFLRRNHGAELYHDYRWRSLIRDVFGHETHYLMAKDASGDVRGVLPLVRLRSRLFGDFLVSMPYFNYGGVLAESDEARESLVAEAGRLAAACGSAHVELRQREEPELGLPSRDDKVTMLLDLPDSEDALWKAFKPKLRAQIRRPEKEGCRVREGGAELLDDFYAVFSRNMHDLGTPVYSKRFFAAIASTFAAETWLVVVYLRDKPVAAGLLLAHGTTLEIPWASSVREANRFGVNMLLYWTALRGAIARGCRTFDFGRSSKDSGTYRFKEQWGARPRQLRWYYVLRDGEPMPMLTPANPKYRLAVAAWQRLPLPIANLLGPHLVKNLP